MRIADAGSLGDILGVWAHPDDENYVSGGIMASAVRNGQRVLSVTATRGEEGSQDHDRWPPKNIPRVREAELIASLAALGVGPPVFLAYRDGACATVDEEEAVERLRPIFQTHQPDTVLTFGPDGQTGHPDHIAVCAWTTTAFQRYAKPGARLYYAVMSTEWTERFPEVMDDTDVWGTQGPALARPEELAIDFWLTEELRPLKAAATRAHESQLGQIVEHYGIERLLEFGTGEFFTLAGTAEG